MASADIHRWTPAEEDWMRENVPGRSITELADLFERDFGVRLRKTQLENEKSKLGIRSGTVGGRFEAGHAPANKGKTWDEFMPPESQERCRATQYKPGNVPLNCEARPVGFERVTKDGYVEVKVKSGLQGKANDNYRFKHHVVWERANGRPVPPSTMIVFADRDKRNFDPGNLVAVPRDVWAVISRGRFKYNDRASLEACVNLVRLEKARFALEMMPRQCRKCGAEFEPRYPNQRTCDACLGRN